MAIPTRVLKSLSGRRTQSIDPAKHFAVHIHAGYADPISREQFMSAIHRLGGTASLLQKLAAAGIRDASGQCEAGNCDRRLLEAMGLKLADAKKMQSEFESFMQQLIFSDQNAFRVVEQARKAMSEAIEAIHTALAAINASLAGKMPRMAS